MPFDDSFLEELSARNDIVDVISQYVHLKRSGADYFGLCPFHNEKTPSFSVVPRKQMFYCFGCGAGGGVINFIMRAEGLAFQDAVKTLADRVGMVIPENNAIDRQAAQRRTRLLALCKDAARYFYRTLWLPENQLAQQYFLRRGLRRKTMNRFGLGYAPNSFHALSDAMKEKGYTRDELLEAGLLVKNEKGAVYDKFRNRVIFPIIDVRGDVIAFGGRVLDDSKPKYLNSPETPIFHKSRNLFALNLAKTTKSDYFILAEGYMDVIALHQAGFDSAVASLGTSLTQEQARMMASRTKQVIISYDADSAGRAAAQRAINILKECDLQVKILRIPGAKDPDEFIKTKGAEAFRSLISNSADHNTYRLEQAAAQYNLEEDESRVAFLREAIQIVANIDNDVERDVYIERAAQMAKVSVNAMRNEVERELKRQNKKKKIREHQEIRSPVQNQQPKDRSLAYTDIESAKREENIIQLLFAESKLIAVAKQSLSEEWFTSPTLKKIYQRILSLDTEGKSIDIFAFQDYLEPNEMNLLSGVLARPLSQVAQKKALEEYINQIQMLRLKDGTIQNGAEDPLLSYSKMKNKTGG